MAVADELAFMLVGVDDRRSADADQIRELANAVDHNDLSRTLERQNLLALLGSRLLDACPDGVASPFAAAVDDRIELARHRHALQAHFSRKLAMTLEEHGIETVAIKGPSLAERIYDDPGLRKPAGDVDYVVRANLLDRAVEVMRSLGYRLLDDIRWADGLPHYHYLLSPGRDHHPNVELHWRVHWYETQFAEDMIDRSIIDDRGVRLAKPVDELACLLLIYARDGFLGLRMAADIGAWWDRYGAQLPAQALDSLLSEHPRLRPALLASLRACEQVVGLPAEELASDAWRIPARARLALRLLNWRGGGESERFAEDWERIATDIKLIDLLLTPRGAGRTYIRHYYLQPVDRYARTYGWRPEAHLRNQVRRGIRAAVRAMKAGWKFGKRLATLPLDAHAPRERRAAR